MYVHRLPPVSEPVLEDPSVTGCAFPAQFPALFEYLTATKWPDGKVRQTATLLVCVEEGRFKGCLNDRAQQRSAWASGASLTAVLQALEEGIRLQRLEWRKSSWRGNGRK